MATAESSSTKDTKPLPPTQPIRRAFTIDESTHRSSPGKRFSSAANSPSPGLRRRSSNFSDYSIHEARKSFQSGTDDLLLPKPSAAGQETSHDSTPWHSAPLAFALLPAIGGMLFKNGSSIITDIMLLGLAAIFLNWSVRLPWEWYHSAQSIRLKDGETTDLYDDESENENAMSLLHTTLDEVPEDEKPAEAAPSLPRPARRIPAHEAATNELYTHEILALLSCFVFPLLGAYLLHTLRSQLSRPSEGLVSNYNLTIFLLASELRPVSHLMKLIQSRTLHLQRVVNTNPYTSVNGRAPVDGELRDVVERLNDLESRTAEPPPNLEPTLSSKQSATLTTEVRKTLQPELDALNRAVRRYEKRATLQAFQTESRLLDLESRLADAISLAAAAADNGQRNRNFTGIVIEWVATAIVLPVQALGTIASLPFKTTASVISYCKAKILGPSPKKIPKVVKGKFPANGRSSERPQPAGRLPKK